VFFIWFVFSPIFNPYSRLGARTDIKNTYGEFPIDNAFNAPHGIERLNQEIIAIVSQPQFYVYASSVYYCCWFWLWFCFGFGFGFGFEFVFDWIWIWIWFWFWF
jgi:hypothetical protein